jgi:hypothetical protein
LQFVAKSLVGENYIIFGLDKNSHYGYSRLATGQNLDHFGTESTRTSFDHREEIV